MSETVTQEQSLPWLESDQKDLKDLADSSIEAVEDAVHAVGDAATDVIDATAGAIAEVSVDHHQAEKAGMPQLDPTWFASQLFWLFVCFTFLYIIMSRAIIPRIRDALESRQSRIESDLELARSRQEEAETVKAEYEASLNSAQKQVRELIHQAQLNSEERAVLTSKEMDAEIQALSVASEKEIDAQLEKVNGEIAPVVEELTSLIVEKIMLKKPTESNVKASVKSELKTFSFKKAA